MEKNGLKVGAAGTRNRTQRGRIWSVTRGYDHLHRKCPEIYSGAFASGR